MKKDVTISVEASNMLDIERKKEILQNLSELPIDVLERLDQMRTDKAVNAIRTKWTLIKTFI